MKQQEYLKQPFSERALPWAAKWSLFAFVSLILGNTFVAYIFGSHQLLAMIADGPSTHSGPFIGMLISSLIILFQFGWFREQVCLFVCPYGRLQSVLLDKDSLIVAYDPKRGEPRGKPSQTTGDCVDCKMCIKVCPTGIDIRNGLQLECVHCTQCIDACDSVMEKLSRPLGLIKYNTESALEGNKKKIIRPRLFIYLAACLTFAALMLNGTLHRKDFVIVTHRESGGQMYSVDDDGLIVNLLRVQLSNYLSEPLTLSFTGTHPENMIIISPEGQIVLQPEEKRTSHLLLKIPASTMREHAGVLDIDFVASDQRNFKQPISIRILGPAK